VEGDTVHGQVKVKLGPVMLTYRGEAKFVERDASEHRVVIDAKGADLKGNGNASVQVTATLHPESPTTTTCSLVTDLNVTGRPAQFGRGMMLEIGNKVLGQFSENLAQSLQYDDPAAAVTAGTSAQPAGASGGPVGTGLLPSATTAHPSAVVPAGATHGRAEQSDALDLLGAARGAALKRLVPVGVVGAIVIAVIVWWSSR
jgi:carbon monoxide dehydrogenase subunit G